MRSIVIDSSVVIKWFDTEPLSDRADAILLEYEHGDLILHAPDLLVAEVGNIIWKKQTLQARFTQSDAEAALRHFQAIQFTFTPATRLLSGAYSIATQFGRTVYDSLYLALSVQLGYTFVTADERLANAVKGTFPTVLWLRDWS